MSYGGAVRNWILEEQVQCDSIGKDNRILRCCIRFTIWKELCGDLRGNATDGTSTG
jgi:hypothetical protein